MIEQFEHFANKYCQVLALEINKTESAAKRDKKKADILKLLYGLNGKIRTVKEVALLKDITSQSVRNIKKNLLQELRVILSSDDESELYEYNKDEIESFIYVIEAIKIISQHVADIPRKKNGDIHQGRCAGWWSTIGIRVRIRDRSILIEKILYRFG